MDGVQRCDHSVNTIATTVLTGSAMGPIQNPASSTMHRHCNAQSETHDQIHVQIHKCTNTKRKTLSNTK